MLLYAGTALLAVSCVLDEKEVGVTPTQEIATVRFTLSVPGVATPRPTVTRSLTDAQEDAVSSVDVLVFHTSGDHSGKLFRREKGTHISGTTFEVKLPEGTYDLVVLGNATAIVDAAGASLVPQTTLKAAAVAALTHANAGGYWTATTIPMWGYKDGVVVDETTSLTGGDAIDMHRMVAKVEVQVAAAAAGTGNDNFELTSVRLYNYNTKGRLAPDAANFNPTGGIVNAGKGIATAPTIPADRGAVTGGSNPLVFTSTHGVLPSSFTNTIYTYEAARGTALTLEDNPCLVVGGSYQGGTETFYRVDFVQRTGSTDTYLDLLRNHRYTVQINSVTGGGHPDPEEAFNSRSFNIEALVMAWEEGGMTGIAFDGTNYLAVSQDSFEFTREERGATDDDNTLTIKTNCATWTAAAYGSATVGTTTPVPNDGTSGQPWLRISPAGGTGAATPTDIVLTLDANESGAERTAYVHVKAGRLTYVVEVVQTMDAKIGVRVVNASNDAITELVFSAAAGTAPVSQTFTVNWAPKDADLMITSEAMTTVAFPSGVGEPATGTVTGGNSGTGTISYTVAPPAISAADVDETTGDPFLEKVSKLDFTTTNGISYASATVFLRQINYNLLTDVEATYTLDSQTETINVRANFGWTITNVTDDDDILQNENNLIGKTGGNNTVTSDAVAFTMAPESDDFSKTGKTATITFTSRLDGSTWDVVITAIEPLYVGMFGGALTKNASGVWQFEKALYVQNKDQGTGVQWSSVMTTTGVTDDIDGRTNTYTLRNMSTAYAAATVCYNKNTGTISTVSDLKWYLPAQKQLMAVWTVHNSFDSQYQFSDNYWSATEHGANFRYSWVTSFSTGATGYAGKTETFSVRCVRE